MFISQSGMVQRTGVRGISKMGRSTQGVKVMNLRGDDTVSAVALVRRERRAVRRRRAGERREPDGAVATQTAPWTARRRADESSPSPSNGSSQRQR